LEARNFLGGTFSHEFCDDHLVAALCFGLIESFVGRT
jgi:hypothetical protein